MCGEAMTTIEAAFNDAFAHWGIVAALPDRVTLCVTSQIRDITPLACDGVCAGQVR